LKIDANERGIIVTVRLSGGHPVVPTRYAQALRRRAVNRTRRRQRLAPLPPVVSGNCDACDGWGVAGHQRRRCTVCGGSGV
jgi:hypothetical protein